MEASDDGLRKRRPGAEGAAVREGAEATGSARRHDGGSHGAGSSELLLWLLFAYTALLLLAVHRSLLHLPAPLDEANAQPGQFVAERARKHLEYMTGLGPRPTGSEAAEVKTVAYILAQVEAISQSLEASASSSPAGRRPAHRIRVDLQRPSGSFNLDFLGGFTSVYANVSNVVVRLSPRHLGDGDGGHGGGARRHALLANCHFDSVPFGPGASDDAVSCAVMLEVLQVLAQLETPLLHDIIFLFNGAEENVLQASHGFITKHPWASLVRAFINLEAAGVGGKELVFQTGPENPWLVQAYVRSAQHPFASIIGQEVFQSGIIPSDTDFRILRDFGNIPGIDLAFIKDGYIYHTEYDSADRIPSGSIQRAGDNILGLVRYLASSSLLADSSEYRHGKMVFFDVIGLQAVAYPARVGILINYLLASLAVLYLASAGLAYLREVLRAVGVLLVAWLGAVVTVAGAALLITLVGRSMSWYTERTVLVGLYAAPALAVILLVLVLAKRRYCGLAGQTGQRAAECSFDAALMLWTALLLWLNTKGICSAFLPALWVGFSLAARPVLFGLQKKSLHRAEAAASVGVSPGRFSVFLAILLPPYLITLYSLWNLYEMFLPIMGRSGTQIVPDVVMAIVTIASVIVLSSYPVCLVYLMPSAKRTLLSLAAVFLLTFGLVCAGFFFPYGNDSIRPTPKRLYMQHISRRLHDASGAVVHRDSGVWVNGFDYSGVSHLAGSIPALNDSMRAPCLPAPFCGYPWFLPVNSLVRKSWYLPAPDVSPSPPLSMLLVDKEQLLSNTWRLTFEVSGPHHISLYVREPEGATLVGWSLGEGAPPPPQDNYSQARFVFYSYGTYTAPWRFWLDMQVTDPEKPMVEVAVATHYLFGPSRRTPQLSSLLKQLPDWTFSSDWVSTYDLWAF
uniref:Endoplasmic reticulum metallopeptidase 1 n=1 Tax=Petromyzon marinus TaxID=7757 RepID=A0AAJ7WSV6_PETMA|nr:endoplasmic reticulum metallopeptidase 1 [Petromyzon marinus]